MHEPKITLPDLLIAWREALRAAELAERLAAAAADAADQADLRAVASVELAELAEQAAASASRAAERATHGAHTATELANRLRDQAIPDADRTVASMRAIEGEARTAYQDAQAARETSG